VYINVIFIIIAAILLAVFMRAHFRHKSPAKAAVSNMILGAAALVLITPIATVAVNVYTVFAALTLGVPGVVLLQILLALT
jgi:low temperature requirement protein LtrA